MSEMILAPRSEKILKALVETYIRDGHPVGSSTLAKDAQLQVSSATIRHIMADLEKQGYLCSPHTSAGRVPTTQGYRFFVDHFISAQPPESLQVQQIEQQLESDGNAKGLVLKASNLLSGITHMTGIVTLPQRDQLVLQQVEFLALSDFRVLVVLVFNDQEVQNRVIHTKRAYTRQELEQAGNFITAQFRHKKLCDIRDDLYATLKQDRQDLEHMLNSVMSVAQEVEKAQLNKDFVLDGQNNLFGCVEQDDLASLKSLFEAFTEKSDILHLLDQSMQSQGVKIFIGEESGCGVLDGCSVITAPYQADGKVVGVLGVIGPCRMAYNKVISTVDITAKILSNAFDLRHEDNGA